MRHPILFVTSLISILMLAPALSTAQQSQSGGGSPPSQEPSPPISKGQNAAAVGAAVDNISTFGVAPLDSMIQTGAHLQGVPGGGAPSAALGNVLDFGAATANYVAAMQNNDPDAAAAAAAQYAVTATVKGAVTDFGAAVAGAPGEIIAGAAFSAGQIIQKIPCRGGTVQDCVTDAEFAAWSALKPRRAPGSSNVPPPQRPNGSPTAQQNAPSQPASNTPTASPTGQLGGWATAADLDNWIPEGWVPCTCPSKHQVQWIKGTPYHPPGPRCP
jgi:hypothetical protein